MLMSNKSIQQVLQIPTETESKASEESDNNVSACDQDMYFFILQLKNKLVRAIWRTYYVMVKLLTYLWYFCNTVSCQLTSPTYMHTDAAISATI